MGVLNHSRKPSELRKLSLAESSSDFDSDFELVDDDEPKFTYVLSNPVGADAVIRLWQSGEERAPHWRAEVATVGDDEAFACTIVADGALHNPESAAWHALDLCDEARAQRSGASA